MDLRDRLDTLIENLINLRDSLDADPDLEAGGDDEPWLAGRPAFSVFGAEVDLEA